MQKGEWIVSDTAAFVTFGVRHSRGEMCIGHGRLCVCLSVPRRIPTLLHGPKCNLGEWEGVPSSCVQPYWADLQSVHGFRAMTTYTYVSLQPYTLQMRISPNAKCQ